MAIGRAIRDMDKEYFSMPMEINLQENMCLTLRVVQEACNLKMEINMMDNLRMIKLKVMVCYYILMVISTKDHL
jgi:hypothetical protein